MTFEFTGTLIYWRGPSPFHFITIPAPYSSDIKAVSPLVTYGWGVIPVRARIGETEWTTALFPKGGLYLLPVRDSVRKAETLELGDEVAVQVHLQVRLP